MSGILRKRDRGDSLNTEENVMIEMKKANYFSMLADPSVFLAVTFFAVQGLIQTTYDTILPIWLASNKSVGGFSWDKKDLAWIVSFVCLLQMSTLLLFPIIMKLCKSTKATLVLSVVQIILLALTPIVSTLNQLNIRDTVTLLFCVISAFHIVRSIIFNAQYVLIANSCYQEFRAKAFCLSQVFASLLRFIGPATVSMLFSWSIEKPRPFPFNYGLSMYVLALLSFLCIAISLAFPISVNEPRGSLYNAVDARMEKRKLEKEKMKMKKDDDMKQPLLETA